MRHDHHTAERQAWLRRLQNLDPALPTTGEFVGTVISAAALILIVGWLL
jgi:hypothetical protein